MLWHAETPIGICVFGYGPLSSLARNRLFGISGTLTAARAKAINRNFAAVSRLVLDPRYRGAGLAAAFLRRCCLMTEWPWIELVSEMAELVPFCQAAGFRRIAKVRAKDALSAAAPRPTDTTATHWGKSGWTKETFDKYARRVRFSRPAYFIFDNRRQG